MVGGGGTNAPCITVTLIPAISMASCRADPELAANANTMVLDPLPEDGAADCTNPPVRAVKKEQLDPVCVKAMATEASSWAAMMMVALSDGAHANGVQLTMPVVDGGDVPITLVALRRNE